MTTADIIDIMGQEMVDDPFAVYNCVRDREPIVRGTMPGVADFWLVTRYDDVTAVMADTRFVGDVRNVPGVDAPDITEQMLLSTGVPADYLRYLRPNLSELDGAEHSWYRGIISRVLIARRVLAMRPRLTEVSDGMLSGLTPGEDEVVDLLADYASPFSITGICELVGIPELGGVLWGQWQQVLATGAGPERSAAVASTLTRLVESLAELIEQRRAEPRGDVVSALLEIQRRDERLDETMMIQMVLGLVLAGHENTANVIANSLAILLAHPDQAELVRAPGLLPSAFDECMRLAGPVLGSRLRYAAEDVEVAGTTVGKGEAVAPVLAAANRDPRKFTDPDTFDVRRPRSRDAGHLGFGYGIHYCSGAAFARETALIALAGVVRRLPGLSLAVDYGDLRRGPNPGAWYLASLPSRPDQRRRQQ